MAVQQGCLRYCSLQHIYMRATPLSMGLFSQQPHVLSYRPQPVHIGQQHCAYSAARRSFCRAASKERYPLKPDQLPSPYMHERPEYSDGKSSLRSALFEVLRHNKEGLSSDDLEAAVKKDNSVEGGTGEVSQILEKEVHFFKQQDGNWSLSLYQPLKWGMTGNGAIAEDTMEVVHLIPGAEVYAVAARDSQEKADEFAKTHGVKRAHANNDAMVSDKDVDLVWVSNIHPAHKETVIPLLEAGKHVLCEKPLTLNAADARDMYEVADKSGKFFMAALWSRFFPAQQKVRQLIESGAVGEVLHFHGTICLPMGEEVGRLYDPKMGGGALLDIGLYQIFLASWVYGCKKPDEVKATAVLHKNGIDVSGLVNLRFGEKGLASIVYSVEAEEPIEAKITGSKGDIFVHERAHNPTKITFTPKGGKPQVMEFPHPPKPDYIAHGDADGGFNFGGSMGFVYEVMAVHAAVVNGQTGYPDVSKEEMLWVMELADEIRSQIGVKYPQDEGK